MNSKKNIDILKEKHKKEAIKRRLKQQKSASYVKDAILGGIDGGITTFAVITGVVGGGFSNKVAIIMGLANLLADGFSMAVSNYQSTKSEGEKIEKARKSEEYHIEKIPEGEQEEIRQIFIQKGFKGKILDKIVETITRDRQTWIDTMLKEELGLQIEKPHPLNSAITTFIAFILVGSIPLIPFSITSLNLDQMFIISLFVTGIAFFSIGIIKGVLFQGSALRSGLDTLLTGGVAALLAYLISSWLRKRYGLS